MTSKSASGKVPKEDPRLSRIRDNQRRSRARKREYIEELESRWKKCQELGVQANMELQRAAQRVIDENNLLRRILAELGLETPEVDKRLKALNEVAIVGGGGGDIVVDDGCCGSGFMQPFQFEETALDPARTSSGPCLPKERIATEIVDLTEEDDADSERVEIEANPLPLPPPPPPTFQDPAFDMNLLETQQDYEGLFDLSEFLDHELLDLPALPLENSAALNQQSPAGFKPSPLTISIPAAVPPKNDKCTTCEPSLKGSIPCTEAYALLKILNAQRQEQKDMFEIVIELWNGFCYPEPGGSDEGKGCRIDNEVLQKVIDGMK